MTTLSSTITISGLFNDVRNFIYAGFQSFPLAIGGTLLLFGLMTANYAMLFFLIGYLILVPSLSYSLNILIDYISSRYETSKDWFKIKETDLCSIVHPFGSGRSISRTPETISMFSNTWLAMAVFFLSYMLFNAIALNSLPQPANMADTSISDKVSHRKVQSMISIVMIVLFTAFLLYTRIRYSGCVTTGSAIWTVLIYGSLGFGWYKALSAIGQNRLSDLFGIANRLLSPDALKNEPVACIPDISTT